MATPSDGEGANEALDRSDDLIELSQYLGRLWSVAGEQDAKVSEMCGVRARLFGYGSGS